MRLNFIKPLFSNSNSFVLIIYFDYSIIHIEYKNNKQRKYLFDYYYNRSYIGNDVELI